MSKVAFENLEYLGPRKLEKVVAALSDLNGAFPIGRRTIRVIFLDSSVVDTPRLAEDWWFLPANQRACGGYFDPKRRPWEILLPARQSVATITKTAAHEWRHARQEAGLVEGITEASSIDEVEDDAKAFAEEWCSRV